MNIVVYIVPGYRPTHTRTSMQPSNSTTSRRCSVTMHPRGLYLCILFSVATVMTYYLLGDDNGVSLVDKYYSVEYRNHGRETMTKNLSRVTPPASLNENTNGAILPTESGSTPPRQRAIVLVTGKRFGSTFIGDIFNHSPGIFYIYEPLKPLTQLFMDRNPPTDSNFNEMALSIINDTLQCRLYHTRLGLIIRHSCSRTRVLNERGLCNNIGSVKDRMLNITEACREQDVVAIKLIRWQDIAYLEPLSSVLDLRIIHLVRDPRPTERSRSKTRPNVDLIRRKGTDVFDEVDMCQHMQHNLQYWLNPPHWMAGKYLLIRYEDVVRNPIPRTMEILNFIGYTINDDIITWLNESTQCNGTVHDCSKTYGTYRNSSAVVDEWREYMPWSWVNTIQTACKDSMNLLGYRLVNSTQEMRNLNIETTQSLNKPIGSGENV